MQKFSPQKPHKILFFSASKQEHPANVKSGIYLFKAKTKLISCFIIA